MHSCGFSQAELGEIFWSGGISPKDFFESLSRGIIQKYIKGQKRQDAAWSEYQKLDKNKLDSTLERLEVNIITILDSEYPESLKHIAHSPFLLYVRWNIPKHDMFGVVGSRNITSYGKKVIEKLVPEISEVFPIVSGGAAGCDTYAHKACLSSGKPTVVVIGTGIDECYPVSNASLFDEIVSQWGSVISIFRVGEPGNPYNFPVRNEIVVWLSRGILVVEAKERSGSLITAWLCLDMWRDLFAIPWDIMQSSSAGTNSLLQSGSAKLVMNSWDILEEYDIEVKKVAHKEKIPKLSDNESRVYGLLWKQDMDIESLIEMSGIQSQNLTMTLSMLELKGIIKKDISGKYRIC